MATNINTGFGSVSNKPFPYISNLNNARQKNKQFLNTLTSLPQAVRVLRCSDVDYMVQHNIGDGETLVWDGQQERLVNRTLSAIAPGAALIANVYECFIGSGGNSGNTGKSSDQSLENIQQALKQSSNYSVGYELLQFWVSGNVEFDLSDSSFPNARIRESGTNGHNKRGFSIRGLNSANPQSALNVGDPPRTIGTQLIDGGALHTNGEYSENSDGNLSNSGNGIQTWTVTVTPVTAGTQFFNSVGQNKTYPVAGDFTNVVSAGTEVYLSNSSLPSLGQDIQEKLTPCKITVVDGDGVGFQSAGNVEFTEIHMEFPNTATTPIHINGEFQILYSVFSNIVAGGTNASIQLSASGWGNDPNATSQINPSGSVQNGGINVRVESSKFIDLNIIVDSECDFKNCVFENCKIQNPTGCIFTNCVFYNCRPITLGDTTGNGYTNNSSYIEKSILVYGKEAAALLNANSSSNLSIVNSIIFPLRSNGSAQSNEIISVNGRSHCNLDGITIPANSGINNGSNTTDGLGAILAKVTNAYLNVSNIKIIGASNANSFVSASNNSDIVFGRLDQELFSNTSECTNAGPLLTTHSSNVYLNSFLGKMGSSYDFGTTGTGVFNFVDSSIKVSSAFNLSLDSGTSIINAFILNNSTISNVISKNLEENRFNLSTGLNKYTFDVSNSKLSINTGAGTANGGGSPGQTQINGMVKVDNNSIFTIHGWQHGSFDSGHNVTWNMNDGSGNPVFSVNNNSVVNLRAVSVIPYTVSNSNVSRAFDVQNNSTINTENCLVNVKGLTNRIGLIVENNSHCNFNNTPITINSADNKPGIRVNKKSTLNMFNPDSSNGIAITLGTSQGILINNKSEAHLKDIAITTASANGIGILNGSKLHLEGTTGTRPVIENSSTTDVNNATILGLNNADINVSNVDLKAGQGRSITLRNVSKGVVNTVLQNAASFTSPEIVLDGQSKMHVIGTTTDIATNVRLGSWDNSDSPLDVAYSDIKSTPFILPEGSSTTTQQYLNNAKSCSMTYSATADPEPNYDYTI